MPFDAPYQQMIHLLSARGLGWFGRQIEDLPRPLSPAHPALPCLAEAGGFAPALAGLRGSPSPLDTFLKRCLTPDFLASLETELVAGRGDPAAAELLQFGRRAAGRPGQRVETELSPQEVEAFLRRPMTRGEMSEEGTARFAEVLIQAYGYGAHRPQFSTARAYGEIFATCLAISDWAQTTGSLSGMARMIYCLCLIDPDFDTGELVGRIMSCQRPDGSFPSKAGHGTSDQDLATGTRPTILAVAALHMALYRRWRQPPQVPLAA